MSQNGKQHLKQTEMPLPKGWCWTTVGEITANYDGRRVPVKLEDRACRSGAYPYYGASGVIDHIDAYLFDGDYLLIAEDGANLLSRSTPIAFRASGQFWVNNHAHVVQLGGNMPLSYLESYLNGTNLQFYVTGTAQPKLNQLNLNRIPVPLAPLNEQHRIVVKIEELFSNLDAGVAALERAKANLKRYRAAVLKAAVEGKLTAEWRAKHPNIEPASKLLERILVERRRTWETDQIAKFAAAGKQPPNNWKAKYVEPSPPDTSNLPELPKGWCWAAVEQLCNVGTGTTPSRKNRNFYDDGSIPWVMSTAVNASFVDAGSEMVTEEALRATSLRVYPSGTLIIALYGEGKTRGMVSELRIPATINQALGAMVFTGEANAVRPFIKQVLMSRYAALRRQAVGGMQPNLNLDLVKHIPVPLPPQAEQSIIVAEVAGTISEIDAAGITIASNERRASRLRQSILKQAFEGKLVPQEANDEPASELLARLKAESHNRIASNGETNSQTKRPKRAKATSSRK